jgi:eukaryotic-like serine/threonine-protein kinase
MKKHVLFKGLLCLAICGFALAACQQETPAPRIDPAKVRVDLSEVTPVVPGAAQQYRPASVGSSSPALEPEPVIEAVPSPDLLWAFSTHGAIWGTPTSRDGTIYFGSDDYSLYAVDAESGELLWQFITQGYVRSRPAVEGGLVFIASDDGYAYAVDRESGKQVWRTDIGNVTSKDQRANIGASTSPVSYDYAQSSPVAAYDLVYIGSADGNIYALAWDTGEIIWRFQTSNKVRATPILDRGVLYAGSWSKTFFAIDAVTGEELWQTWLGGQVQSTAFVDGSVVYTASRKASVVAIDAGTGQIRWEFDYGQNMWVESSPMVRNGIVYAGSSGSHMVIGLDAQTGIQSSIFMSQMFNWSSPVVAGNTLFIGGANNTNPQLSGMLAIQLVDGMLPNSYEYLWLFNVRETLADEGWSGVVSNPVVDEGRLYFGGLDGVLYALEL